MGVSEKSCRFRLHAAQVVIDIVPFVHLALSELRVMRHALQGIQYLLLVEVVLLFAVILYAALYWLAMPLTLHDQQLYFDYSNNALVS